MKKYTPLQILMIIIFFPFSLIFLFFKNSSNKKKGKIQKEYSFNKIDTYNTVRTPKDVILNKHTISSKFDLSNIIEFQKGYYLIQQDDISFAKADILSINELLYLAHKNCPSFPLRKISAENLYFEKRILNGRNSFCFISFESNTPSGKEAKYPIVLHFDITQNFFGQLYYLQNGSIGKANITVWKNNECFQLTLHTVNNELCVNSVYQINNITAKKEKIFSSNTEDKK